MTSTDFNQLVHEVFDKCSNTLLRKADEYTDEDRLSNFKKAARMAGCTPAQALMGFKLKHDVATQDFVNWDADGKLIPMEYWTEKVVDSINYLILLYALVKDTDDA